MRVPNLQMRASRQSSRIAGKYSTGVSENQDHGTQKATHVDTYRCCVRGLHNYAKLVLSAPVSQLLKKQRTNVASQLGLHCAFQVIGECRGIKAYLSPEPTILVFHLARMEYATAGREWRHLSRKKLDEPRFLKDEAHTSSPSASWIPEPSSGEAAAIEARRLRVVHREREQLEEIFGSVHPLLGTSP